MGITKEQDGTFTVVAGEQKQSFKTEAEADTFLAKAFGYDKGRAEFSAERKAFEAEKAAVAADKAALEAAKTVKKVEPVQPQESLDDLWKRIMGTGDEAKVDEETLRKVVKAEAKAETEASKQAVIEAAQAAGQGAVVQFMYEERITDALDSTGLKGKDLRDDIRNSVANKLRANPEARLKDIPELVNQSLKERVDELTAVAKAVEDRKAATLAAEAMKFGNSGGDLSSGGTRIELGKNVDPASPEGVQQQVALLAARRAAGRV